MALGKRLREQGRRLMYIQIARRKGGRETEIFLIREREKNLIMYYILYTCLAWKDDHQTHPGRPDLLFYQLQTEKQLLVYTHAYLKMSHEI